MPGPNALNRLWTLCNDFIEKHDIQSDEAFYQVDSVNEALVELGVEIFDIIGPATGAAATTEGGDPG